MVSDASEVEMVGIILKECESVARAKINADKSVGLQLGYWKGRMMPSDGIVGLWTDRPFKVLGV